MLTPGGGVRTDISGLVTRLTDAQRLRYRVRAGDSTGASRRQVNTTGSAKPGGQGPKGGAPVWSYSTNYGPQSGSGWNTPPDITQFEDVFQPSGGLFAPGYPLTPVEKERLRQWDYPIGYNYIYTPRSYEPIGFKELRALSTEPITRVCIETRKDQVGALDWMVKSKDEKNPENDAKSRQKQLVKFFEKPDGYHSFDTWLRWQLEEVMVTDAPCLQVVRNRVGEVIALPYIDGATIKVLIDDMGRRPVPPAPAYEQIIHGRPWVLGEDGRVDTEERGEPVFDEQIVYLPRNSRGHKPYGFCYDAETEVLTRRGWLTFSNLTLDDLIATRNCNTKAFEWQRPSHLIARPYDGPMWHFHSQAVDLLVTPEHRMLVTAMPRAIGGNRSRRSGEAIISAEQLAKHWNHELKFPATSLWLDGKAVPDKTFVAVPVDTVVTRTSANGTMHQWPRRYQAESRSITGDDYCALLGAYLAEGNPRSQGGIEIAQQETSKGYGPYGKLISRICGRPAQHNGRAFVIPWIALTEHFRGFGKAHEKFIPDEVMNATPDQLRLFWDHYVLGDGSIEPRINISGRGKQKYPSIRITTTSQRMAGQLVEIAQKLGWSASCKERIGRKGIYLHKNKRPTDERNSYRITVRYSEAMSGRPSARHYSGMIYCATVPNGILYVRRNGKPAWAGNSPCEQIILTINTALRRQVMQLQHFTDSNVPNGILTSPDSWTADQILAFQEWFDSILSGNTARRTSVIWVPSGAKYQAFKEAPFKDGFDEWLARIISYAFSLPPTPFVQSQNRATAAVVQEVSREEGLAPLKQWVKILLDNIIQDRMGHPDLEFSWIDEPPIDSADQEKVLTGYVQGGVMTRNEAREALGLVPIEGGDDPTVQVAGQGLLLVKHLVEASENVANPPSEGLAPSTANGARKPAAGRTPSPRQTRGQQRSAPASKASGRITKEIAEYTHAGTQERCRDCSMFKPPDACSLVIGVISPNAHCRFWEAKLGAAVSRMLKAGHVDPDNAVPVDDYFPLGEDVDRADVWHQSWEMVRAGEGSKAGYTIDRQTVPADQLRATQDVVDRERVARDQAAYEADGQDLDELPLALEHDGLVFILAGHHHVAGAIAAGATRVTVDCMVPASKD